MPKPSIINIVGASIGRALKKYPAPLYFAEAQINHHCGVHCGVGLDSHDKDGNSKLVTPYDASMFLQCKNSLIARFVNKKCGREGHVFSATARSEPAIDDGAAVTGEPIRAIGLDRTRYHNTNRGNKKRPKSDFMETNEFSLTPPPMLEHLPEKEQQQEIYRMVKHAEVHYLSRRDAKPILCMDKVLSFKPTHRPKQLKRRRADASHATPPKEKRNEKKRTKCS